jgi:hypothetical protein
MPEVSMVGQAHPRVQCEAAVKLTTIWTMRGTTLGWRIKQTGDTLALRTASHLPKRVKYWAFVLVGTKAMDDNEIVSDLRFVDLMERAEGAPK